ncbi:conjugal transfer mating pair stabilization protein TraG [Enterobacteriaceae bacterium H11S18]|uniref:conjugal transfer mating-pair stabilization protein TraG n=1 Tax=Dryocola clanedunensis TaxID=2925396 RepID=UPI0022EFF54D|nr:conjugal transfer mating-pair stabilization protein TraG [Dryocola clanedunensis]MCT4709141.1 conjugal transfer mating pair stabilization protein TraG [Dryocola clanedunensis]
MSVDTVYVLAGGDFITAVFNGLAIMLGTTNWASMFRIASLVSVMVLFATYIRGHDPKQIIGYVAVFLALTTLLILPKRTVQVIDRTDPASVYVIDNVPLGVAAPAKLITGIGTAMTEGMEAVFHTPDAVTYSKTGMLYGANLVGSATDFVLADGDLAALFTDYVRNCVVGDIMLNHKYSMQELMNSTDPYALIFSQPSPLRGVMVPWNNTAADREGFWTCQELAKNVLEPRLNVETGQGGTTWNYWVSRITGNRPDSSALFGTLLADSYGYYYGGGQSASHIMRAGVVMNGIRQGIASYASRSGDAAGLLNLSTESSYTKMRLSQATSANIATTYIPLFQTVLTGLMIGTFPIIILLAVIPGLTASVLKGYVFSFIYLQSWAPMFAILNFAVSLYLTGKTGHLSFSISNLSQVQETHADIGAMAGRISLLIPALALYLVKGLASGVGQVYGTMSHAMGSTASSEASNASNGQWAFNNLQTDNVAGNKWDTNYQHRSGQASTQLESGASITRTGSGNAVYDTSGNTSNLPISLQADRMASAGFQRQQREAMNEAQSLSNSLSHTASMGASQLSQWSQQRGNSDSVVSGSDSSTSSNVTAALSKLNSITSRYAQDNNVSQSEAVREAMEKSQNFGKTVGGGVSAGFDSNRQIAGKIAGFATGLAVKGDMHAKADYNANNGSSHGTSSDMSNRSGSSKDYSAQELKDIRDAADVISSQRTTDSSSHTDNSSGSLVNQMASTFSEMQTQASQYNAAQTRSHEYAQMASYVENNSAAIRENATQEFVGYVRENSSDADRILTDTQSPEARAEREQLAGRFVEERMMPRLQAQFEADRARTESGMGSVSAGGMSGVSEGSFEQQRAGMEQTAAQHGVQSSDSLGRQVNTERQSAGEKIDAAQNNVTEQRHEVKSGYSDLEADHQNKGASFDKAKEAEQYRQQFLPDFSRTEDPKDMLKEAKDALKNDKD